MLVLQTVKMMAACVIAYTLAWLPLNLYIVAADLPGGLLDLLPEGAHILLFFIVHSLAMSHTCYNPVIYFWMNGQFRRAYYRVLPCLHRLPFTAHSEGASSRQVTSKCEAQVCDAREAPAAHDGSSINLQVFVSRDGSTARYHHSNHDCHTLKTPATNAATAASHLELLYVESFPQHACLVLCTEDNACIPNLCPHRSTYFLIALSARVSLSPPPLLSTPGRKELLGFP